MDSFLDSHGLTLLSQWDVLTRKTSFGADETSVDGHQLDIATLVAVARLVTPNLAVFRMLTDLQAWSHGQS